MADGNSNGNGLIRIWPAIIATAALLASLFGGFWLVEQAQVSALHDDIEILRRETGSRREEIKHDLEGIHRELLERRQEFVSTRLLDEAIKRLDGDIVSLQARLGVVEATRPTGGELQATANALDKRVTTLEAKMETRVSLDAMHEALFPISDQIKALHTQQHSGQ
jgi:uncharacterized protein YydD (DUF2326 family)